MVYGAEIKRCKMVLHSAQYKRQNNEDAAFEDIMVTNVHNSGSTSRTTTGPGAGSIINSNSISLGSNNRDIQPSTEVDLSGRMETNNDDSLSTGSDRLCNAPEGHVRFVNSTIRYHMAGPGFW